MDATDDPLYGTQEGRFFHGYYDGYCYLPLYVFCGDHLLCAKLGHGRTRRHLGGVARVEASGGADSSALARRPHPGRWRRDLRTEEIMAWCEGHAVDYLFGLEVNSRLLEILGPALMGAHITYLMTGVASREWADFWYQTRHSWSQPRRVVARAAFLPGGPNPRFVVTSVAPEVRPAQALYEEDYCGRGDVENRIKEQKLDLASGRTSIAQLRSNQLRLWFMRWPTCW